MRVFLISLIFSTLLMGQNRSFNQLVLDNQIDLKAKSIKSWMRIFNSEEKIKEYGFKITNTERYIILKGLEAKQNETKNRYSRRLR